MGPTSLPTHCRWLRGAAPAHPSARTATVGRLHEQERSKTGGPAAPASATHGLTTLLLSAPGAVFLLYQQPNQEPLQVRGSRCIACAQTKAGGTISKAPAGAGSQHPRCSQQLSKPACCSHLNLQVADPSGGEPSKVWGHGRVTWRGWLAWMHCCVGLTLHSLNG